MAATALLATQSVLADEGFRQSIWATTNNQIHAFDADSGDRIAGAESERSARSIGVDLKNDAAWVYGQGRLRRHGFDGALELDLDVPETSPGSSSGNGTGNGGEKLQDLEIDLETGEVWLGVKRKLYRYSAEGELLGNWTLESDTRALTIGAGAVWLLTQDALWRAEVSTGSLQAVEPPTTTPLIEISAGEDTLWMVGQREIFRLDDNGETELALEFKNQRQMAAIPEGGAWIADAKSLIQLDQDGLETARFDHANRGRTVDLELDPRDGTPWLASQQDLIHYTALGEQVTEIPVEDVPDGARFWDVDLGIDVTPPEIAFVSPAEGTCLSTATPTVVLEYSDEDSGPDPASLRLYQVDQQLESDCETDSGSATCHVLTALPEGEQLVSATVSDHAGNESAPAELNLYIDTIAPAIEVTNPVDGFETFDGAIQINGRLSESAPLLINGGEIEVADDLTFSLGVDLAFGENPFVLEATDCAGNKGQLTLTITRLRSPPEIVSGPITKVRAGEAYSYQPEAVDPDPDDELTFALIAGPQEMSLDAGSGLIQWQTDDEDVGLHEIEISVVDLNGDEDRQSFQIEILPSNRPPEAYSQSLTTEEGVAIDLRLTSSDPDGDLVSYVILAGPEHGRLVGNPPQLTYVPDAYYDGDVSFTFMADDGQSLSDPAVVSIGITGTNSPPRIISEPITPHVLDSDLGDPEPQRLSEWSITELPNDHGPRNSDWNFLDDGFTAIQQLNAPPSVIGGVVSAGGMHFEGTWHVNSTDDDFVGFVVADQLPYRFYRFRWKKNTQGEEDRGMSLIAIDLPVDGSVSPSVNGFGLSAEQGIELYENDIPWSRGEEYRYTLDFRPGSLNISVKDESGLIEAVSIKDSTIQSGDFGIYHSSITNTSYTVSASEIGSDNVYWYDVEAIDPDGDELTYRLINAPDDIWINPETGTIRWETVVEDAGAYPVTVEVENEHGLTDTQHYQLVVQEEQPVIVSEPQTSTPVGEQYRYLVTAIDPNPDDQLTYSLESGPDGAFLDPSSGLLTWTPGSTALGEHDFTVSVTDSLGLTDEQTFTLQVNEVVPNEAPVFTSEPVVKAYVGQIYAYAPKAEDPDGDPVQYGLVGDLPYHMQIFDGKNITWQPGEDQVRDWTITVDARDGKGGVTEQTFTIKVEDVSGNRPPAILSEPTELVGPDSTYTYQMIVNDPDGDDLSYSLPEAPNGMSISSEGQISWALGPNSSGFYPVTARVEDGQGGYAEQSYTLAVQEDLVNTAPVISSTPVATAVEGTAYSYAVAASDADGDPLTYGLTKAPEGMVIDSASGLIQWTASSTHVGRYDIALEVKDGRGGVAVQTYTLDVTTDSGANQAPAINSEPEAVARTGITYTYQIEATDPEGDALSYELTSGPSAMTLSSDGLIAWAPESGDIGTHEIELEVRDGRGGVARQWYSLVVVSGDSNNPPQILSTPPEAARAGLEYRYSVVAEDPEGDPIAFTLLEAPPTMSVDPQGNIRWTPDRTGEATVTVRADDGSEFASQTWTITVAPADAALNVSVSAQPSTVDPGEPVTITAAPEGMAGDYTLDVQLDSTVLRLDESNQAIVTPSEAGLHSVTATLSDAFGSVTNSATFTVREVDSGPPPEVSLSTPDYEAEITAPIDVYGSVSDDDLDRWILAYAEAGTQDWVTLAEGTQPVSGVNLGTFDPTLLINGQYRIALQAWDAQGQTNADSREVQVTGKMKLGHFSMTFEEVTVPLSGIPVTLTRTYDSRQRHKNLDFGYGWSVGYKDVRLQESRRVGLGWSLNEYRQGYFSTWCVEPNGDPIVTVRLPDDEVHRFRAKASPECQQIVPYVDVHIVFEPLSGTHSSLEQLDHGLVRLINGNIAELDRSDEPLDPDNYLLTLRDGTKLRIGQHFGLRQLTDTNDNTLTYTEDGIVHSNGVGIDFVRDGQGRIEQVLLPDGEILDYVYDIKGDLSAFSDERNNVTQFTYRSTAPHYLQDVIDPRGVRAIRNEYDSEGRMIAQIDADGNRLEFDHDIEGRTETITDRRGNSSLYVYDDRGYVVSETNALGETTQRTYDEFGNELTRIDPLGHTWQSSYDSRGNKVGETNPLGESTSYSFNDRGDIIGHTAADGTVVMDNDYNDRTGRLLATEVALGNVTTFDYNIRGEMTRTTDAAGNVTEFAYDGSGNRTLEIDPRGIATEFTYDAMGNVLTETTTRTNAAGETETLVTTHEYDAAGNRIQTTDPLEHVTRTEYNANNQVTAEIDALGQRTEYEYDDRGNRVLTRYPDGTTETVIYDAAGNEIARTDQAGRTTKMVYDAADRLIEIIHPDDTASDDTDNPRTIRTYDDAGNLVGVTDERGNTTTYEYDDAGRRIAMIDALGHRTDYVLDARGRRAAVMDPDGHTTSFEYDDAGRRTATVFPDDTPGDAADDPRVTTAFDALGRKIAETDEVGQTTRFVYDAAGQLVEVIEPDPDTGITPLPGDPGGVRTTYGYDEQGNKTSQTDALGRTTSWAYDELGRSISRTLPLGQTETYAYDAVGNRVSQTDFNGETTTYGFDAMNRQVSVQAPDRDVTMTYTANGLRASVTVAPGSEGLETGTTTWSYDTRDRTTRVDHSDGTWIEYTYDAAGNRTALETPNGTTGYSFDELNRLSAVTAPGVGITDYTYNAAGDRISVRHPNGTEQVDSFDARHRLTSRVNLAADGSILSEHHYTLSDDNRRLDLTEDGGRTTTWTYDARDRLIEEQVTDSTRGNRTTRFVYDPVGNRLERDTTCNPACGGDLTAGTTTYSYDDNDRLTSESGPAGTTTYQYDDNGSLIEENAPTGTTTYGYNSARRLTEAQTPADSLGFAYDTDGIRQTRTENGQTTNFLTDANRAYAQVIEESDATGSLQTSYVHGHDLLSQNRAGAERYFHPDGLGSTRALSDGTGVLSDQYGYSAYGESAYESGSTESAYRYTGEQLDVGLGQYYLRARYYQPEMGRFSAIDPFIGSPSRPTSLHRYQYADFEPVAHIDPSGEVTLTQLAVGTGIATVLANSAITGYTLGRVANDSDGIPDGVSVSFRGGGARGLGLSLGLDFVYDFRTGELWAFGAIEGTLAPLTLFRPAPKVSRSATAGFIWNMSSPQQFNGRGSTATWPISTGYLLARARRISTSARGGFWGFMTQTRKFAKSNRGWSLQFGFSGFAKDGPAFARIGPSSSFSSDVFGLSEGRKITNARSQLVDAVKAIMSSARSGNSPGRLKSIIQRIEGM